MDKLEEAAYFASSVYVVSKPDFLEPVSRVSQRYLSERPTGQITTMSGNFSTDPEITDFAQYVSQSAWNILAAQGYQMNNLVTFFTEMWTQEHQQHSHMDTHVHGMGAQISAFFFLEVPPGSFKMVIHDPRPAKVIISMPAASDEKVTPASTQVIFTPQPGHLIFTNAWLPHSFTRNTSELPVKFVHMNLSVSLQEPSVEVV
jgi:uncharacterized protein (TIGR02466 family)